MAAQYQLPLPPRRGLAGEFYDFCKRRELRFQRCLDCATWRHLPRELCARCGSPRWEWSQSSGRGKVFTWTTVTQASLPQFGELIPYSPVVVEMEERVRLVSWVVDVKPDELQIDMPVEVFF